jgi:hypothetical protein
MDIIVTLPAKIKWEEYQKELDLVLDGTSIMSFKVPVMPKCIAGDKCFLVHKGYVVGFMIIVGVSSKEFSCTVTGKKWKGIFVERSGPFYPIKPFIMKGFQGFRYASSKELLEQKP